MKHIKKLSALLMCALIAVSACITASAANEAIKDTTKKGSITITVYNTDKATIGTGTSYGDQAFDNSTTNYTGVQGLVFELYNEAGTATTGKTATTNSSGVASFSNLNLGTYTVKVKTYPGTVKGVIAPFKVTTPITNATGNGLLYDVKAYPKLQAIYGNVTLTKKNASGTALQNAVFKLEKKSGSTWSVVTGKGSLTTNASGQITVSDLPYGEYRFVETAAPNGYNLDTTPIEFKIDRNASGSIYTIGDNGSTYKVALSMKNYASSSITKTLLTDESHNIKQVGGKNYLNLNNNKDKNTITWEITTTVPEDFGNKYTAFYIEDTLDDAFEYASHTITVGTKNVTLSPTISGKTYKFDFKNNTTAASTLEANKGKQIRIVFNAKLVKPNITSTGSTNKARLYYTTNTGVTKDVVASADPVLVGGVSFKKTDEKGTALQGAQFKLYATEADAKAGTNPLSFYTSYTNDASNYKTFTGWGSVATSGADGVFGFYGLPAGTYYMVETKAPTGYELLKDVKQITVGVATGSSYTIDAAHTIQNKKKVELPFTGGVGAEVVVASGVLLMVAACFVLKKRVK